MKLGLGLSLGSGLAPLLPGVQNAPTITGNYVAGQTLTATTGVADGLATSFTYQFLSADDTNGAAEQELQNSGSNAYALPGGASGYYVSCRIIAINAVGSVPGVQSAWAGPVTE